MPASREVKWRIRAQEKAEAKAAAKAAAKAKRLAGARAKAVAAQDGDPPVTDMDAFRDNLARRIRVIVGNRAQYWRDCPERCCRRARACRVPKRQCGGAPERTPSTPEQTAWVMARVRAAIAALRPPG